MERRIGLGLQRNCEEKKRSTSKHLVEQDGYVEGQKETFEGYLGPKPTVRMVTARRMGENSRRGHLCWGINCGDIKWQDCGPCLDGGPVDP